MKAMGKRQWAHGIRQKAMGNRQKAKGKTQQGVAATHALLFPDRVPNTKVATGVCPYPALNPQYSIIDHFPFPISHIFLPIALCLLPSGDTP